MLTKNRMSLKQVIEVVKNGTFDALELISACAVIGIIIGTVSLTGLALKVATVIIAVAGSNMIFALILTHLVCILLGMGLPTTAKYIMVAMMAIPALIELGVVPICAHLFVFYYAILSDLTPPVALGALAASGVAKAPFGKNSSIQYQISSWRIYNSIYFCTFASAYSRCSTVQLGDNYKHFNCCNQYSSAFSCCYQLAFSQTECYSENCTYNFSFYVHSS